MRLLAVLLTALVAVSCVPPGPLRASHPSPSARVPLGRLPAGYQPEPSRRTGGVAVAGLTQYPAALASIYQVQTSALAIEQGIYNGLLGLDSGLQWYADLAREVPTLENGAVVRVGEGMDVTFTLRDGLRWSDGLPITPEDVIFTWSAIMSPANPAPGSKEGYDRITGIEPRGQGLVLHLKDIYPAYRLLFGTVLPKHRLAGIDSAKLPSDGYWQKPDVVSGPFLVADASPPSRLTLARNPHYADGRSGMPVGGHAAHLDSVVFRFFETRQSALAALKAGEIQVALDVSERDLDTLGGLSGQRVELLPELQYEQLSFNQLDPNPAGQAAPVWAGDAPVMEALDLAVDRPGLLGGLLRGQVSPAITPVSPLISWASETSLPSPRFDPGAANRILDADGWIQGADGIRQKSGRRLAFSLTTTADNPLRGAEEEILVKSWHGIGAEVKIQNFPAQALFATHAANGVLARGLYEVALWSWSTPVDPDSEFGILHSSRVPGPGAAGSGQNYSRCRDSAIDKALMDGRAHLEQAARASAYRAFEAAYMKARCEIPLYWRPDVGASSRKLHNYVLNAAQPGNTWNVADWWLEA